MSDLTTSQREALTLFTSGVSRLETAVAGLSETDLDWVSAPGEWSIRQIVHHVADDGDAWSMPFKKARATPGAPIRFEGFPGNEAWAEGLAFDKRPIVTAVALMRAHRRVMAELAEYFSGEWERCVSIVDSEGHIVQQIGAGQIIRMLAEHLNEHVSNIEALKQKQGTTA